MSERTLPTGTITFLASDMEGSTRLVTQVGPAAFREILERHNDLIRAALARHGGVERGTQGDSFLAMFSNAGAALAAAADAQRALAAEAWTDGVTVRVRMGLHTGVGMLGGDDYVGIDVHRTARIAGAAHGGQVLLSDATRALVVDALPPGTTLRSLGRHKLRDIPRDEPLHQLVIEGLPADFPPIRTQAAAPGNLPTRLTSFVGREGDLAELLGLLRNARLITLTGPGGTGKTSLAVELARRAAEGFPDGAWFVRLDAVSDARLVASTVAATLGLREVPGQSMADRLAEHLAERAMLLVLDNFEQVLPAAGLVVDLLQSAPRLAAVVTSRAALRVSAEQEYPVAPLPVPGAGPAPDASGDNPAVDLFVDRARHVRPGFAPGAGDVAAIAEICRRLDGLPLGIELAASRVALLDTRSIAARLTEHLDLPGASAADLPERQRSMERAIDWSYQLLDGPVQRLLARLSVFRGGCRLEEAEAVCGPTEELGIDVLEGLSVLVNHSLVRPEPGPDGVRYRLLETIRAYAVARLAQTDERQAVERRHALAFRDLAERAAAHLPGGDQVTWLDRLAAEHDNLRAAVRWAVEHQDTEMAQRLGAALWRFWQLRGHIAEGLVEMGAIMRLPGAEAPTVWRMRALEAEGGLHYWSADLKKADALYEQQVALARRLGDVKGTADALFNLGHTRFMGSQGEHEDSQQVADQLADEAERLYREIGDERSLARVEWTRANRLVGLPGEDADQRMRIMLDRFVELGDDWYVALAQGSLCWATMARRDFDEACRWGMLALVGHHAMGDIASTTIVLRSISLMFLDWGMPAEAATVLGAFDAACRRFGVRPPVNFEDVIPGLHGHEHVAADDYPQAVARGASMSLDEVVDYVIGIGRERLATGG